MNWAESILSAVIVVILTWFGYGFRNIKRQHTWLMDSMVKVLEHLGIKNGTPPGR